MNIKTRLFLGFLIIGIFIGVIGTISIFQIDNTLNQLIVVDKSIKTLHESQNLLSYAINIKYYDEVLTQAARNYAFTENEKWKLQYNEIEPLLSKELSSALLLGTNIEKEFFMQVGEANDNLVEMELKAIKFVESGDSENAITILESEKYWEHKKNIKIVFQNISKVGI